MKPAQTGTLRIETPRAFVPLLKFARYKGAYGGRGSGKSHFFAELAVERAAFEPLRIVCIREVQKSLDQSVKVLLEDKIKALGLESYFRVLNTHIEGRSGSLIIFQGMQNHTAESIKSLEGYDIAWVEEAQALSQQSLKMLRPTIRKDTAELWFSWNPRSAKDPVDALLRGETPPPRTVTVSVNYEQNPWFPASLREEMEYDRRRDPEGYQHIWCGQYELRSERRVFKNWSIDEFETPADAVFYFGADWGFSVDPTVLIRCYIGGSKLYVDREAYQIGCQIERIPALFDQVGNKMARDWVIRADSARPETIDYVRRNGYPKIIPTVKGKGSVEDGVEFLKNYDIVVHPRCRHTIDELTLYSYKTDPKTNDVLPILEDKKNHVIDALRYAVEGVRRNIDNSIPALIQVH